MELDRRERGCPKKTWWDCVSEDMESVGQSCEVAQDTDQWKLKIRGEPANLGLSGKWPLKRSVFSRF